jgi:hypothetical protein
MAGKALPRSNQEIDVEPPNRDFIKEHVAKLYGQGFERPVIARMMVEHLVGPVSPNGRQRTPEQRLSLARQKLRKWEFQQTFRDLVYASAVVKLDMATPGILKGVAQKAKRGRVDAARLALELTGRHNPKGEQQPAQVAVIISGVPRPRQVTSTNGSEQITIEANEALIREDEDV